MTRDSKYIATLPDGSEWRMMEIGDHGLWLIVCHPKEGIKMYRLDGSTLVEEKIVFEPKPD